MLSKDCIDCKYVVWMVALGQGVRCSHTEHKKYKKENEKSNAPVVISYIPSGCNYFENREDDR